MKTSNTIVLILSYLLICMGYSAIAQIVDSTGVQNILTTGVQIATATNNTIIKGVPNEITGSLITLIAGFIIRLIEKRHLRKRGKLVE
tara:strand:+ start:361 stop:624 length:264 start_codon:yes stop_codon:yes gene_type:complete